MTKKPNRPQKTNMNDFGNEFSAKRAKRDEMGDRANKKKKKD